MRQAINNQKPLIISILVAGLMLLALEAVAAFRTPGIVTAGVLVATILLMGLSGGLLQRLFQVIQMQLVQEEPIGWRQDSRQLLGFIERLLKGCENQRISGVQIPTQSPFFVVLGVEVVSVPQGDAATTEELARAELEVCSCLSASFSRHYFWPMNIDGRLICVVNLQADPLDPLQTNAMELTVLPLAKQSISELRSRGIRIRVATSGLTVGTESLSVAYQDSVEIFDQLLLRSPEEDIDLIVVNPRAGNSQVNHVTRSQTERLFVNYITVHDFENAKLALMKLIEYEGTEQSFSTILKQLTMNRLAWTLDVLSGSLTPKQQEALSQSLEEINETAYFEELKKKIDSWFDLLSKSAVPQMKDSIVPRVMEYISENCFDSELNVSVVSEKLGINASYLSNSFHSQTGIRLTDFIHQQRLKKVKQLLRETDLTMAQIAKATGYYNAIAMSRVFKRYEGITPSAYRNS